MTFTRIARHILPTGFVLFGEPILFPAILVLIFIWLLPHTPVPGQIRTIALESYTSLPGLKVDLHPTRTYLTRFPRNKTALYLEPRRDVPHLLPLLLHMLEIIPADWHVLFLGSEHTTSILLDPSGGSTKTSHYIEQGRLRVVKLEDRWAKGWGPRWDDLKTEEMRSRLLTNKSFYEHELKGAEYLFHWTSQSVLCANAGLDLDAWLEWDWVGAPWTLLQRGSTGDLSLRKISQVLRILNFQSRDFNEAPEDQWLGSRMALIPNVRIPDSETMKGFAVEAVWHDAPMGYLIHDGMFRSDIWGNPADRKKIFEYCPEVKMILDMKLSRERCPEPVSSPPNIQPPVILLPPAPADPTVLPEVQYPPPPPELESLIGSEAPMEEYESDRFEDDQDGDREDRNWNGEIDENEDGDREEEPYVSLDD